MNFVRFHVLRLLTSWFYHGDAKPVGFKPTELAPIRQYPIFYLSVCFIPKIALFMLIYRGKLGDLPYKFYCIGIGTIINKMPTPYLLLITFPLRVCDKGILHTGNE